MMRLFHLLAFPRAIYVLVAVFVLLGTVYSVTTPIFEAGDELWHYPHVQWIARGNGLPVQDPTQDQLWEQEGGQPPLYYLVSAALTFWIDTSDMPERLRHNPYAKIGIPLAFGNKNMVVHTSAENFPWQGTALAVHLIRWASVLLSAGTVFLTFKIARELTSSPLTLSQTRTRFVEPSAPAFAPSLSPGGGPMGSVIPLLAASFVAFNPMFLFISASVNNDSLAALFATLAIFLAVRLITRGVTRVRVLVLGIVVGLAVLTKVSNLALGIVVVSVLAYCAWRQFRALHLALLTRLVLNIVLFCIPIALITGWWFVRNYLLYGDPLAFNVWMQIAGGRAPQTVLGLITQEFQGFRISFWGNFGGVNIIAPEWVYTTLDVFLVLAAIGLVVGVLTGGGQRPLMVYAMEFIAETSGVLPEVALANKFAATTTQSVPSDTKTMGEILRARELALPQLWWILGLHVAVVLIALIRWTLMTYASQGRLMFPAIASIAILFALGLEQFGHGVWRIAYRVWQLVKGKSRIAYRESPIANRKPADDASSLTLVRTRGLTFDVSRLTLYVSRFAFLFLPTLLALFVLLFALAAPFVLIAPVYAQPPRIYEEALVPNPVRITYEAGSGQPELVGFDVGRFVPPGQALPITLYWRTAAPIAEDLAMYIHVYDTQGELIGQWDAFPGNGLLPTSLWQPNEVIVDEYRVPVNAPALYPPLGRVEVGMSRVGSRTVLPARNPQGEVITPLLGQFKFVRPTRPPVSARVEAGDQFGLVDLGLRVQRGIDTFPPDLNEQGVTLLRPGELLHIGTVLQARQRPDGDYVLFAHLVDPNGTVVSQYDAQPLDNAYPTSLWDPNEHVADILRLDIPRDAAGRYTLRFGIYRADTLERLPLTGEDWDVWRVAGDHLTAPVEVKP